MEAALASQTTTSEAPRSLCSMEPAGTPGLHSGHGWQRVGCAAPAAWHRTLHTRAVPLSAISPASTTGRAATSVNRPAERQARPATVAHTSMMQLASSCSAGRLAATHTVACAANATAPAAAAVPSWVWHQTLAARPTIVEATTSGAAQMHAATSHQKKDAAAAGGGRAADSRLVGQPLHRPRRRRRADSRPATPPTTHLGASGAPTRSRLRGQPPPAPAAVAPLPSGDRPLLVEAAAG